MDGLTMGGGAGIGLNAPVRVASERVVFSMPECAIGLYPDIGAAHFLQRCPGELGMFLALTGCRRLLRPEHGRRDHHRAGEPQ